MDVTLKNKPSRITLPVGVAAMKARLVAKLIERGRGISVGYIPRGKSGDRDTHGFRGRRSAA